LGGRIFFTDAAPKGLSKHTPKIPSISYGEEILRRWQGAKA
jgi:hypothetical protein